MALPGAKPDPGHEIAKMSCSSLLITRKGFCEGRQGFCRGGALGNLTHPDMGLARGNKRPDPRVSLAAITVLMDRLFGKPAQQISADIKTNDIGRLHLEALQFLQARREERLLEITTEEGSA